MGTDYYPRLSSVANDNLKCQQEINQQAEIALLILSPFLIVLLVFVQWGVVLLYSKQFLGVVNMIHWAALGIFFQAVSWSIAFVLLAKGASRIYFRNEVIANIYLLTLNIAGYYFFGLTGLGISFLVAYFFYFIQMFVVCRKLYHFSLDKSTIYIFIVQFSIAIVCFSIVRFLNPAIAYSAGCVLIAISAVFSWKELNKRIPISAMIQTRFKKNK